MLEHLKIDGVTTYVNERWGPKRAQQIGDLLVVALVIGALGVILGVVTGVFKTGQYLFAELAKVFPSATWPAIPVRDALLLFSAILITLSATWLLLKRINKVAQSVTEGQEGIIEGSAKILADLSKRLGVLQEVVNKLDARVKSIESKASEKALLDELVRREVAMATALVIHSARYGIGQSDRESVDVKAAVEGNIRDDRIDMLVTNDTLGCGNVFAGSPKTLFVSYSVGNQLPQSVQVKETHKLVLPEPLSMRFLRGSNA